jgi:hypothetical protein
MMLSAAAFFPGRKKIFAARARSINAHARIHVERLRKSAVRRTPKTVPIPPVPNEPARPPPLLDCIRTTIMSKTLRRISIVTIRPNMKMVYE